MAQRTGGASGKRLRDEPETQPAPASESDTESRRRRISDAAYYRAERRGFAPGQEDEDWLEAEKEIDGEVSRDLKPEDNRFPAPK